MQLDEDGITAEIIGKTRESISARVTWVRRQRMNFPVSIKGVLVEAGRVVLLENERDEWELPGGRLEPGEAPMTCLVREFAEELGAVVVVASIIDCWVYGFCLNARSSSSPTVCSAATRKSCVSAMNIGGLGFSRFTK